MNRCSILLTLAIVVGLSFATASAQTVMVMSPVVYDVYSPISSCGCSAGYTAGYVTYAPVTPAYVAYSPVAVPVVTYSPVVTGYAAPVVVASPFVPGQPVRNFFRALIYP
jgi:hypothetical protein